MPSAWNSIRIDAVSPGATHEGAVLDQFLTVGAAGHPLTLFDMMPMLAEGVAHGVAAEALIAVDARGLARGAGGKEHAKIVAATVELEGDMPAIRPEARAQAWSLVQVEGVSILLSSSRFESLGKPRDGETVSWKDATYFLIGFRLL